MARSGQKQKGESQEESGRPSQVRVEEMDGSRGGIWGAYLNQASNDAPAEKEVMAEEEEYKEPSMVSDLSDYSKDQLLELVQEQRKYSCLNCRVKVVKRGRSYQYQLCRRMKR
jgi:hypothetical protein